MLSDKWIHSTIREMQVADSIRYREAVTRLKRLLYDSHYKIEPSTMKSQNERKNYTQKLTEEFEKEEDNVISQDLETSTSSGILGMVKQQDELITQLEKENNFLKAEMASTIEVSKEITLQNEEFRKRLTDTLAQMEITPDISLQSEGQDKVQEIMNCLKDEREHLMQGLKLQEETIATLRKREIAALDKVKEAIELAEDSQKLSEKVRTSSELSHAELQTQAQVLHDQLLTTQKQLKRAKDREKENEKIILDQERNLLILEEEKKNLDKITSKQEMELAKKVRELDIKIRDAESDKQRLEKLLREQKKTSETTLKRLEALLDRRNHEAETFMSRRSSLEKQIRDAKDENLRLIEAVNELAKDRGQKTDDDKYAKQLSEVPPRTREELNEIKTTVKNHQDSILSLQNAVVSVRDEMTRGMDDLRENLEELCLTIKEGKVDTKDSAGTSSKIDAEDPKSNSVSNEPLPHSSRSEGYESLSESTQPSLKLVERRAKTEHMEDPSSSNVYDHSFSKIIVPLPRKAVTKMKENIIEPKDIDETEIKDSPDEIKPNELLAKPLQKVKIKEEENNMEKVRLGNLEVLKENEAEEDKGDEAETTKIDIVKEVIQEEIEEDIIDDVEKSVPLKNDTSEIDLGAKIIEGNSSSNASIKEDIVKQNEEAKEDYEALNLDINVDILHRDTKEPQTEVKKDSISNEKDSSVTNLKLESSTVESNKGILDADNTEVTGDDAIEEESTKIEIAEDSNVVNLRDETSIATSEVASTLKKEKEKEIGKLSDESSDDKPNDKPQKLTAIYKSTIDNKFENMDELENLQNEFETVEEDVNSSEEGSLNGKDALMEKEVKEQYPVDNKVAIEEGNGESEQKIQDGSILKEDIKDPSADVETLPDSTSISEGAEITDEN